MHAGTGHGPLAGGPAINAEGDLWVMTNGFVSVDYRADGIYMTVDLTAPQTEMAIDALEAVEMARKHGATVVTPVRDDGSYLTVRLT